MTSEPVHLCWRDADWAYRDVLLSVDSAFYPPGYAFPLHNHDYAELYYIDQGSGWHCLPDQRIALTAGDLALIHPKVVHALAASDEEALLFRNIAIPGSMYEALQEHFHQAWPWTYQEVPPNHRLFKTDLQWFNEEVIRFGNYDVCRDRLQVEAFIIGLCARLARHSQGDSAPAWLSQLMQELRQGHFLEGGVKAMAERAGVSSAYLTRSCSKHYQLSAMQLVQHARLDHAVSLLNSTHKSLIEVAEESGFNNIANFHRRFKQRYHTTPAAYRRQNSTGFV